MTHEERGIYSEQLERVAKALEAIMATDSARNFYAQWASNRLQRFEIRPYP